MSTTPGKSCKNCPSYLAAPDTARRFRKVIGSPMCGKFGFVLGKPGASASQEDTLSRHYAGGSAAYGEPASPLPLPTDRFVTVPDMVAATAASGLSDSDRQ